ncbi:DNA methyltransferase [Blastomonas fulva]|uniref:DNA methyltransferase n=1 Tax=Blastomonas fulva TaxID=1550728 RepID=UPI003D2BE9D6
MSDQLKMESGKSGGPVECLGITFPSEDARRDHFLNLLAEKLKDPAFRAQEGFPKGTDKAILAMSDPPYYTACPNPWLAEFVTHYGRPYDPAEKYAREPMAIDVSEGKTDALYKAHSYHTKVPHLAIVPSILHYTEPGDVVLDGFSGSGMTGVAAQWCGIAPATYRHKLELEWKKAGSFTPKWGTRRVVLNDLSPAATFIGANYNIPFSVDIFAKAGKQLLRDVEREIGWMYETLHSDGKTKGRIQYTVWSESLSCTSCAGEVVFTSAALDEETQRVAKSITCPHCGAEATKEKMDLVFESFIDPSTGSISERPKRTPAIIVYKVGSTIYSKAPDKADLETISKIANLGIPAELPLDFLPDCQMTRVGRMRTTKTEAIHHMFLPRAAQGMSQLWNAARQNEDHRIRAFLLYMVEQAIWGMSILARYAPTHFSQVNQYLSGVF